MLSENIERIRELIKANDTNELKSILDQLHPADIAELCDELEQEEAQYIYMLLEDETAADVIVELDDEARKEILETTPSETIAKRLDYMDTDDAVELMRDLDENKGGNPFAHRRHRAGRRYSRSSEI